MAAEKTSIGSASLRYSSDAGQGMLEIVEQLVKVLSSNEQTRQIQLFNKEILRNHGIHIEMRLVRDNQAIQDLVALRNITPADALALNSPNLAISLAAYVLVVDTITGLCADDKDRKFIQTSRKVLQSKAKYIEYFAGNQNPEQLAQALFGLRTKYPYLYDELKAIDIPVRQEVSEKSDEMAVVRRPLCSAEVLEKLQNLEQLAAAAKIEPLKLQNSVEHAARERKEDLLEKPKQSAAVQDASYMRDLANLREMIDKNVGRLRGTKEVVDKMEVEEPEEDLPAPQPKEELTRVQIFLRKVTVASDILAKPGSYKMMLKTLKPAFEKLDLTDQKECLLYDVQNAPNVIKVINDLGMLLSPDTVRKLAQDACKEDGGQLLKAMQSYGLLPSDLTAQQISGDLENILSASKAQPSKAQQRGK